MGPTSKGRRGGEWKGKERKGREGGKGKEGKREGREGKEVKERKRVWPTYFSDASATYAAVSCN